jgi:serine protease
MRRLFAELPSPWRYVLLALAALGLFFVLRWIDEPDPSDSSRTTIHLKLRPHGTIAGATPEFHLAHGDARALWFTRRVATRRVAAELARLAADPDIDEAYAEPVYTLPTSDSAAADPSCPISTPSYTEHQGYLGPAPGGIDAPAAWRLDTRGQGVQFADLEGGWNAAHEDLPGDRIEHVWGTPIPDPSWRAHGTAVLGEVVGRDNGKGVVGIAPDVDRVYTSSIGNSSVADSLDAAAEKLRAGDVLLIELQGTGPRGRFVPMEYWDDNYDVIKAATSRGVVVIEAAGNGDEDLDLAVFAGKFDRNVRDSGAILVGAGGPPRAGFRDRERLDFSNYGARVDVQGWGRMVATLDYGDLQRCKGAERSYTDRHYTGTFSGTSSASPIVAGAAILVESYLRQHTGSVMGPEQVRQLLRETGTPQAGTLAKQIGPRPDLARAFEALRAR